jgi:hypothetical protein
VIQLAVLLVLVAVAAVVAVVLARRGGTAPARAQSWAVPTLVRRDDFDRPDAPWLVLVLSSSTCLACQGVWEKAVALESDVVAVQRVDAIERKDLHDRYGIDAVPMTLLVDAAGGVRRDFVGPVTATDLWAALAELRDPGSVPPGCDGDICG